MNKINLKLAFRNIFRNKLYSVINVTGLGVASAFCILVCLYIGNERSFDRFHRDQERLFRVEESDIFSSLRAKPQKSIFSNLLGDGGQVNMIQTPMALAVDLKRNFPEIEAAVRFSGMDDETIKVGDQSLREKGESLTYTDADFFEVFNFPLVAGNPASVLSGRNQVVISERFAKKYFGNDNPVGKIMSVATENNLPPLTVTGVYKNFPSNSSFRFDMILPIESNPDYQSDYAQGVNSFNVPLVIKLKKGIDVAKFQAKLDVFGRQYFKPIVESMKKHDPEAHTGTMNIILRPFADAHYNQAQGWFHYTDLKNIYQLACLTLVILIIACLNYILLTLTSAISRSQDVGVRKTIGAGRFQIILQYYTETQLLAFIAVMAGLLIAAVALPFFESLIGTSIDLSHFSMFAVVSFLFVLGLILGVVAGVYPAFAMSGLKPLNIMRGFSSYRINPFLSKSLVVIQFTVCLIMVIATLGINKQLHFINEADMGFNKDEILMLRSPYNWPDEQKTLLLRDGLSHYASTDPAIADFTTGSFYFGGMNYNGFIINGEKLMVQDLNVDYNYFSFLKIPIIKGRAFSRDIATDSAKLNYPDLKKSQKASLTFRSIVVNETLYNILGQPRLGELNRQMGGIIIGVCKDYHTQDLTKKIEPAYHTVNAAINHSYWLKIGAGQSIPRVMEKVKNSWNQLTGNQPFDYTFMDAEVAKSYDGYLHWLTTITTSCILAIVIACMGLFGLSGLTTLNRTKEIGIRKVLGASVINLFLLLNRGTVMLSLLSLIIAAPISWYLVHEWLDNFAYRIDIDWTIFTGAAIIAVIAAAGAVSYHTIKAAIAKPVKSLRSE